FPLSGGVVTSWDFSVVPLRRYLARNNSVQILLEVLLVICAALHTYAEWIQFRRCTHLCVPLACELGLILIHSCALLFVPSSEFKSAVLSVVLQLFGRHHRGTLADRSRSAVCVHYGRPVD